MPSVEELVRHASPLFSLPDIYIQVKALVDDPKASLSDIAAVIGRDPALTARLLKIANSPLFGMAARIETITRAVALMGTQQVHDLVLATSLTKACNKLPVDARELEQFWHRSVLCAAAARQLAFASNVLDSERLFVAGLLHNIGHLILVQHDPEEMKRIQIESTSSGRPAWSLQREIFGLDSAAVGGHLLHKWNLPAMLVKTVSCHTRPVQATDFPLETSLVHVAAVIAQLGADTDFEHIFAMIDAAADQRLALDPNTILNCHRLAWSDLPAALDLIITNRRAA